VVVDIIPDLTEGSLKVIPGFVPHGLDGIGIGEQSYGQYGDQEQEKVGEHQLVAEWPIADRLHITAAS
jgi:hypothetical protein